MCDIGSANGEEESGGSAVGEVCRPHLTEKSLFGLSSLLNFKCVSIEMHGIF